MCECVCVCECVGRTLFAIMEARVSKPVLTLWHPFPLPMEEYGNSSGNVPCPGRCLASVGVLRVLGGRRTPPSRCTRRPGSRHGRW